MKEIISLFHIMTTNEEFDGLVKTMQTENQQLSIYDTMARQSMVVQFLYVLDEDKHEIKHYRTGNNQRTVLAGANATGKELNHLFNPTYVVVDKDHSVPYWIRKIIE